MLARAAHWLDRGVVALLIGAALSIQPVMIARAQRAKPGASMAVIFAPWTSAAVAMQRVAAEGARILRFGAFPFIVIAQSDDAEFAARMGSAGAVLLIETAAIAGCFKEVEK